MRAVKEWTFMLRNPFYIFFGKAISWAAQGFFFCLCENVTLLKDANYVALVFMTNLKTIGTNVASQ